MPIKFVFVISPSTHFLDLAGPDQVIHEAIYFNADFQLEYCAYSEKTYTSSGLHFAPLKSYKSVEIHRGDYILLPGLGLDTNSIVTPGQVPASFYTWLNEAYDEGVNICSICTGAFLLAPSGLLNGKNCTTHWKYTQRLQRLFPRINVMENILYTDQDRILTSAGIAAGIDMALHIVEKETDAVMAYKVAKEIVVYIRRSGNATQKSVYLSYRNHMHYGIHQVQDWLVENLNKKVNKELLARLAHMSTRNFTRVFKNETGITMSEYIHQLRKEKVSHLLKNPDLTRYQIARQVGLDSVRHLSRIMQH